MYYEQEEHSNHKYIGYFLITKQPMKIENFNEISSK